MGVVSGGGDVGAGGGGGDVVGRGGRGKEKVGCVGGEPGGGCGVGAC